MIKSVKSTMSAAKVEPRALAQLQIFGNSLVPMIFVRELGLQGQSKEAINTRFNELLATDEGRAKLLRIYDLCKEKQTPEELSKELTKRIQEADVAREQARLKVLQARRKSCAKDACNSRPDVGKSQAAFEARKALETRVQEPKKPD